MEPPVAAPDDRWFRRPSAPVSRITPMTAPTRLPADREVSADGWIGPHHDGSDLYVGSARPAIGDVVPIRIRVPHGAGVDTVRVRMIKDGEPTFVLATSDGVSDGEQWFVADVTVHNP